MRATLKLGLSQIPGALALARLTMGTIRICMRNRVTGLAAESGFFAVLSLPPLIFGLLGAVGYLGKWLGPDTVNQVTINIQTYASQFLTEESLRDVLVPTIESALNAGRPDVISVGFLLSLWSGSRALNVTIDTVSIMYGQGGHRGIIGTRLLSLSLYLGGLVVGAVVFPLILIGPDLLTGWLPPGLRFLMIFYWPLVAGLTILSLATLFFIATPSRSPWVRDIPGAALTLVIWVLSSMMLRWFLGRSIGDNSTSIYGPLAAAIVVLTWMYFIGIAVLIGAAMNAASVRLWPPPEKERVGERATRWVQDSVTRIREVEPSAPAPLLRAIRGGAEPTEAPEAAESTAPVADTDDLEAPRLDSRRAIG